ncbi:MAG: DUF3429 domain-containing protein [Pseudomonadota bacterium]
MSSTRLTRDDSKPSLEAALKPGSARHSTIATRNRRTAWLLSLAGIIPFAFLSLTLVLMENSNPAYAILIDGLKTYAAVILSFLGGIRWGNALHSLSDEGAGTTFAISVVPSLVGWFSLLLPLPYVFAVLALAFAAQGAWDTFAGQFGVFGLWFARLRMVITGCVAICLAVAFFATA